MGDKIGAGRTIEASEDWIVDAQKMMGELVPPLDQRKIAARIINPANGKPIAESTVSRFFTSRKSRWANEIADVIGMPRPYILLSSRAELEWIELGRFATRLGAERYEKLIASVRAYLGHGASTAADAERALDKLLPTERIRS